MHDETEVTGEIQDKDSGHHPPVQQHVCECHREIEPVDQRDGELLRLELLHMRQASSKTGQMDSYASPLHEIQTETVDRQLPNET